MNIRSDSRKTTIAVGLASAMRLKQCSGILERSAFIGNCAQNLVDLQV